MNVLACLLDSFMWANVIAVSAFQSRWLEGRVNGGYVFFLCWIILFIVAILVGKKRPGKTGFSFSAFNAVICLIYHIVLLEPYGLITVPAAMLKSALPFAQIPATIINIIFVVFIASVLLILFRDYRRKKMNTH
jgi:hypothetical protein